MYISHCNICACYVYFSNRLWENVPFGMLQEKEEEHLCALMSKWKTKAKTWGTGVVGRQWMSSSFASLSTAVCILQLFTRWMRSFFSLLEMKQHVVKWLSHSPEPFKDDGLNAALVNLVAKIWWLLFIMLLMRALVMIYSVYYYILSWSNIIKRVFSTISLWVC